jgi:hypothetical protein
MSRAPADPEVDPFVRQPGGRTLRLPRRVPPLDVDASTELEIDSGLLASIQRDVALEQHAARHPLAVRSLTRNAARNRSATPAPTRRDEAPAAAAPRAARVDREPRRDEAAETGIVMMLSALFLVGGLTASAVLGVVVALGTHFAS